MPEQQNTVPRGTNKKPPDGGFIICGGRAGIGFADLAKFADANRHTSVCLFAAVQTLSSGSSSRATQIKNHLTVVLLSVVDAQGLEPWTH